MAANIKVTPKQETPDREGRDTPPLDLLGVAAKKLMGAAKKRGYVTHDQINALLGSVSV